MSLLSLPLCAWNDHRHQHFISQPDRCPRGDLFVPHCTRLSAPVGMFLPVRKPVLSPSENAAVRLPRHRRQSSRRPLSPAPRPRVLASVCPAQTPHTPASRIRPTRHEKSFTPLHPRPREGRFVPRSVCPACPPGRPRVAFPTCSRRLPGGRGGRPFPRSRRLLGSGPQRSASLRLEARFPAGRGDARSPRSTRASSARPPAQTRAHEGDPDTCTRR